MLVISFIVLWLDLLWGISVNCVCNGLRTRNNKIILSLNLCNWIFICKSIILGLKFVFFFFWRGGGSIRPIRSEAISDFNDVWQHRWLSSTPEQDVSLSLETFPVQLVSTYIRTGRQSVAENFPNKIGMGRGKEWRWSIFPKDKTHSADAGNRTVDPQIQSMTLYRLSQQTHKV